MKLVNLEEQVLDAIREITGMDKVMFIALDKEGMPISGTDGLTPLELIGMCEATKTFALQNMDIAKVVHEHSH